MRSRFRKFIGGAVLAVVLGAAIGVPIITHGGGGGGISAQLYVSASGSDANSGDSTHPVASFAKAYQLWAGFGGITVSLGGGVYPSQPLPYTLAKPLGLKCDWAANNDIYAPAQDLSGCITYTCTPGQQVILTGFGSEVPYVHLDGGPSKCISFDKTQSVAPAVFDNCEIEATRTALTAALTGNIVNGQATITGLASTAGLSVGHVVLGTSANGLLPTGDKIASIDSSSQVTLTQAATATRTGATFRFDTGQLSISGTSNGTAVVTGLPSTSALAANLVVTGPGIPAGTKIASVDSSSQITLTNPVAGSGTIALTVATGCYYPTASIAVGTGPISNAYTCTGLSGKPTEQAHDDILENFNSNGLFNLEGQHNAIRNVVFTTGDTWNPDSGTSHMQGCRDNTVTPTTAAGDFLELDHVTVKDGLFTRPGNGCDNTGKPACAPSGWQSYHVAALHWEGGTNSRLEAVLFQNNGGHSVELEPEDGYPTASNLLVENSVFGQPCAQQPSPCTAQGADNVTNCHLAGTTLTQIVWRFDAFIGTPLNNFSKDTTSCNWGTNLLNYADVVTVASPTDTACTGAAGINGGGQATAPLSIEYTVFGSNGGTTGCGSNNIFTGPQLTSTTIPYDPHLQPGSPAIAGAPAGTGIRACPPSDYYGNARPQGVACDIGPVKAGG